MPVAPSAPPAVISPKAPSNEKVAGRIMVPTSATPEYLWEQFTGKTNLQGRQLVEVYIGHWMRVTGELKNVYTSNTVILGFPSYKTVDCVFSENWRARLAMMQPGESLDVLGKIDRIDSTTIYLKDCELS
jgi:hypothetical protein